MSKRRKKQRGRPEWKGPTADRQQRVNRAVREELTDEVGEAAEGMVGQGLVSSYVDDDGEQRFYVTPEQAAMAEEAKRANAERELRRSMPLPEMLQPEAGMGGNLSHAEASEAPRLRDPMVSDLSRDGALSRGLEELLSDPGVLDSEKELRLVREYLGAEPAAVFGELPVAVQRQMLKGVMEIARGQRDEAQENLKELQREMDRNVEAQRILRMHVSLERYVRSELVSLNLLRPSVLQRDMVRLMAAGERIRPQMEAISKRYASGETTEDIMASPEVDAIRDVLTEDE